MWSTLIVAEKEFRDHLTSKRFLIVLAILLLLSVISMAQGMSQYNDMLDSYKRAAAENPQQQWFKDQVASLRQQIADAQARGAAAEEIEALQYQLDKMINPDMPSMLFVFSTFNSKYFIMIGMLLSVIISFDLITKEREEGSLRSLLSHPVYRDSVINGKLIAVAAVLVASIGMVFMLMFAVMLFYGVVPSGDDLLRAVIYFLMALLYCGVFFAFAMMASAVAKNSAMAIMIALGIAVALLLIPQSSYDIAGFVLGPPPEVQWVEPVPLPVEGNVSVMEDAAISSKMDPAVVKPGRDSEIQQYYEKQRLITDVINTISPMYNFGDRISNAILYKSGGFGPLMASDMKRLPYYTEPTLVDSLASVWINILALIGELIIPLAISYVIFLRSDVR